MKAIRILVNEHILISKTLSMLSVAAENIVQNKRPSREFFEHAIKFTRKFTNKFHHYKEEVVMFGLLAQKHDGKIDAFIERLRSQHEILHNLVAEISALLDGYSRNEEAVVRKLHRCVSEYCDTLREHIHVEDKVFYPMVEFTLTKSEQNNLLEEFERWEADGNEDLFNVGENIVGACK